MIVTTFGISLIIASLLTMQTLGDLNIQLFVLPNMSMHIPQHNFWPWVPLISHFDTIATSGIPVTKIPISFSTSQVPAARGDLPGHNFWPFIPMVIPNEDKVYICLFEDVLLLFDGKMAGFLS